MKIITIILLIIFLGSCQSESYGKVSDRIIEILDTQEFYEMGIKNDTLIDINSDGILDSINFAPDPRYNSYMINDSVYYSLHVYNYWTVLDEIDGDYYVYDVITTTDSDLKTYISESVYKINKDFSLQKIIEFKRKDSLILKNSKLNFRDLKQKYLNTGQKLTCDTTERELTDENDTLYGFVQEGYGFDHWSNHITGEIPIGKGTLICLAMETANRNPFTCYYFQINSTLENPYHKINKTLQKWKKFSKMEVFKFSDEKFVIYERALSEENKPYRILVIDQKNHEIEELYEFDYHYELIPIYDPEKFEIEQDDY